MTIHRAALFLVIALGLPATTLAKKAQGKTPKAHQTRPTLLELFGIRPPPAHPVLPHRSAEFMQGLLNDTDWLADQGCEGLNKRSHSVGELLDYFGPRFLGSTKTAAAFDSIREPRWGILMPLTNKYDDPDLIAEIKDLPEEKRPAAMSLSFFPKKRIFHVSDWPVHYFGNTVYRDEDLSHVMFFYFYEDEDLQNYCRVDVIARWVSTPRAVDAEVQMLTVSLRKHKDVPADFHPVDRPMPTLRETFLDPLRQACLALNRLPTSAVAFIDFMGADALPVHAGSATSNATQTKGVSAPEPSDYDPLLERSFRLPGSLFTWGRTYWNTTWPQRLARKGTAPEAPRSGPEKEWRGMGILFADLQETPLVPTVARLVAALSDDEHLYRDRGPPPTLEGIAGHVALAPLLLTLKPPGAAHFCTADIVVAHTPGHALAGELIKGVRPFLLVPAASLNRLLTIYQPYSPH